MLSYTQIYYCYSPEFNFLISLAFLSDITFLPVSFSNCSFAILAIFPPFKTESFALSNPLPFLLFEISVEEVYLYTLQFFCYFYKEI